MPLAQLQRTKLATVGILALVLGAGFLLGAAWNRRLDAEPVTLSTDSSPAAPAGPREGGRQPMYMLVQPPLTPDQLTAAEEIVARRRDGVRQMLAEPGIDSLYDAMKGAEKRFKGVYDPRFRELIETSRAGIREIMTPDQARQYDSLLADFDGRRRQGGGDSD
jgi:hypothetical protein